MSVIPWAPMPKTVEDEEDREGYAAGAVVRARHRQRMVMRWRNKEARDEDRSKRRLPVDWHDWMMCPAEYGYKSRWCTCDGPLSNAPRAVMERDRGVRGELDTNYLLAPFRQQQKGVQHAELTEPVAVEWVKSIDAPLEIDSMVPRRRGHAHISHGLVAQDSRLARLGARSLTVRAPASGKDPHHRPRRRTDGRLGGSPRIRLPSWLSRVRRHLSLLWAPSSSGG